MGKLKLTSNVESYMRGEEPPQVALATAPGVTECEFRVATDEAGTAYLLITGLATSDAGAEVVAEPMVWLDRDLKWARTRERLLRIDEMKIPVDGVDL